MAHDNAHDQHHDHQRQASTDGTLERVKDKALGKHDDDPGVLDHVGEGVGGVSGVVAGAAVGSAAGPVGTIIGGIAGAMAGWWTGRAVSEAATAVTTEDDTYYRRHYEASSTRSNDFSYDDVRPAYHLGHVAARNPDYRGRGFDDIEPELRSGWTRGSRSKANWELVRSYVNEGYHRGRRDD